MRNLLDRPLIVTAELRKHGETESDIAHHIRGKVRVRRGVHVAELPTDREARHLLEAAAVVATHEPGSVLSGVTAALIWELPVMLSDLGPVQVTRIGRLSTPLRHQPGVLISGSMLSRRDVVAHGPALVTSPERTVLDCARSLPKFPAVAIADAAAHGKLLEQQNIRRLLSQMKGWKGIGRARRVLAAVEPLTESPGETWTRLTLAGMGIQTVPQVEIRDDDRFVARVDFLLVSDPVVVEFDGRSKYELDDEGPQASLWREKRRHDAIVQAGYEVVRVSWEDLADEHRLGSMIAAARDRVRRRSGASGGAGASGAAGAPARIPEW